MKAPSSPRFGRRPRIWIRSVLAISVVAAATALSALIGAALGAVAGLAWLPGGGGAIQVLTAVAGFSVAWWWYAVEGQRWISDADEEGP